MKRENLSFLIEGREIILIKYCILFLTTCYFYFYQFTIVAKKLVLVSTITHGFFVGKIVFLLKYNYHYEYFYCSC